MTVNNMKPFLGILGAALVALVFAAPNAFAAPAATAISADTVQVVKGDVALIGDDQPAPPPSDQKMEKPKKGKHKGKKGGKKGKKPTGETAPKSDAAPK